jgi:hypothetical protein
MTSFVWDEVISSIKPTDNLGGVSKELSQKVFASFWENCSAYLFLLDTQVESFGGKFSWPNFIQLEIFSEYSFWIEEYTRG